MDNCLVSKRLEKLEKVPHDHFIHDCRKFHGWTYKYKHTLWEGKPVYYTDLPFSI
jgi:hypothetical protein